jgi:dTMP kinase
MYMKPHNKPGFLITFCGLDGCGKTTVITMLHDYLESIGISVILTKQPTSFVRSSEIFRTYMDSSCHDDFDYRSLSLLAASDRVQHSNRYILPLLERGEVVISDRYFYSCLANLRARGYTQDEWIYEIASFIPKPDISFFLDVDVNTSIARIRARVEEKDRYIDMALQHKLKQEYVDICKNIDGVLINSNTSPEITFNKIISKVNDTIMRNVSTRQAI